MNKLLTILSLLLIATVAFPVNALTSNGRTIVLKKKQRHPIDTGNRNHRVPSPVITCYVEAETGIQPLDTSEIESYEVWDCTDSAPIMVYENEKDFVDYILNDDAQGIIKLFTTDYIYVGELDSQTEL